jgi:MinD-like ATPase involved in chromosome partitioning or flagellar assembly
MRIALAVPPAIEGRLDREAVRYGHEVVARTASAEQLRIALATARPDVVIVGAAESFLSDVLLAACDATGVRLVALVETDPQRRRAASMGLFETVDAAADWPTIERSLSGASAPTRVSAPEARRGQVIAVWGPAGAPGRTTIAIGIAAELAALGHSVALADCDTMGASIAPSLGMLDEAPGFAAACRLAGSDSLNRAELERIGERYESPTGGFWVLTGIGRSSRWPELSADRVRATIAQCREWVDFTVLDTGSSLENDEEISSDLFAPRRNASTVTAVHEADHVVAVGAADTIGLSRFLRAHVDVIEAAATTNLTVVMNRVRASAIGMNPAGQVTQTLARFGGIESPVLVPYDLSAVDGAVLSGRTLLDVAPRSPTRIAMRDMVAARFAPVGSGHRRRRR